MMEYVINKGIAGLGNRLQSLGWALDIALAQKARLVVDWRDVTWRSAFNHYFTLDDVGQADIADVPENVKINPPAWRGAWNKQAGGRDGCKAMTYRPNFDCDAHVICIYNHAYSDELCNRIRPSEQARRKVEELRPSAPYDAYHIRHTDKQTDDWQAWLELARRNQCDTGKPALIVTDNMQVQAEALKLGLASPSFLVPLDGRGGVHHVQCDGDTKRRLNTSAVVDMWLCIEADTFTVCCPHSSFSQFIERMRKIKGKVQ